MPSWLASILSWRGPDAKGPPLWGWATLLAALFAYALLAGGQAPVIGFLWWGLLGALLLPVVQKLQQGSRLAKRQPAAWEGLLSAGVLLTFAWSVWSSVYSEGHIADTKDHHIMLERTREMVVALQAGHIQYYTHYLQGGDSLWDLYPIVPGVFVALVDSLSPSSWSFENSYTFMVVASWWLRGLAIYSLSRRIAGIVPAALVTLGCLYDVGAGVWDGTWAAAIHWGMIHSNVSLSFAALAISFQIDIVRKPRATTLWAGATSASLALLSHPLALLYLGGSTAATACAAYLRGIRPQRLAWLIAVPLLGLSLSAWYLLPYLKGLTTLGVKFPWPGESYSALGAGLLNGQRPFGDFGAFYGFALLACCVALASRAAAQPGRATFLRGQAITSLVLFCLILSPLTIQAQLFELMPGLLGLQPARLFMVLKVCLAPVMAWGLSQMGSHLTRIGSLRVAPTLLRALLLCLLTFGVGHSLDNALGGVRTKLRNKAAIGSLQEPAPALGSEVDADLQRVMDWVGSKRNADASSVPWRMLAKWDAWDQWGLWWFPWKIRVPMVLQDPLPGNFLGTRPQHQSGDCMHAWNVRFVVTRNAQQDQAPVSPVAESTLRFSAGRYHIFEIADYDSRFVLAPAGVSISNLQVTADTIRFEVNGASGPVDLQIRSAWFPRWRARQNGQELKLTHQRAHADAEHREEQLLVRAGNGTVTLKCNGGMPGGQLGALLSWLGLAFGVVLSVASLRARAGNTLRGMAGRFRLTLTTLLLTTGLGVPPVRRWWTVGAALTLLTLGGLRTKTQGASQLRLPGPLGSGASFTVTDTTGRRSSCQESFYSGTFACSNPPHSYITNKMGRSHGSVGEFAQLWPGIALSLPPPGSILEATFDDIQSGHVLKLRYDLTVGATVRGSLSGKPFDSAMLSPGWGSVDILLPKNDTPGTLSLRFESASPGAELVFSGQILP